MQQSRYLSKLLSLMLFIFGIFSASVCLAKDIILYEQPQEKSKIVGSIDLAKGIIPIYTPKNGEWMKVGDPQNGNVGWIKSSEITANGNGTFTFSQRILDDGKGAHTYQIIEYGKPENLTGEQMQTMIQKMQNQQRSAQQNMQKAIQNMVNEINSLYQKSWGINTGTPIIMPIVILPAEQNTGNAPKKK